MKFKVLWIAGLILATTSLQAQANAIINGSFENGAFVDDNSLPGGIDGAMNLNAGDVALSSWNIVNGSLGWLGPNVSPWAFIASDGNYCLDLTGYETTGPAGVTQTIATQIGDTYLLTFDIGNDNRLNTSSGSAIWATAGNGSVIFGNVVNAANAWQGAAMSFQALSTSTVVTLQGWAGDRYIGLDNVSVTHISSTVPEPASIAMWGFGALGLMFARRKRQQKKLAA